MSPDRVEVRDAPGRIEVREADRVAVREAQVRAELRSGVPGPPGPPGDDAFADFEQLTPLTPWVWAHNLGKRAAVTVVSLAGKRVNAELTYLSDDAVQIDFAVPFAGRAYAS